MTQFRESFEFRRLFDSEFYLQQNPDVAASRMDPLAHFLGFGARELRNPHPLFDTRWYLLNNDVPDGKNPLQDFFERGATCVLQPHPLFDTNWYLNAYPDIRNSGIIPIVHYLDNGESEGRDPCAYFSSRWYRSEYSLHLLAEQNALVHYATAGWRYGFNPSADFDGAGYIRCNPDVAGQNIAPLSHYIVFGKAEGRPFPSSLAAQLRQEIVAQNERLAEQGRQLAVLKQAPEAKDQLLLIEAARALRLLNDEFITLQQAFVKLKSEFPQSVDAVETDFGAPLSRDAELIAGSAYFDGEWYLTRYPDVAAARADPLIHYLNFGAGEGRDPSSRFSTKGYLALRPDVAAGQLNPLVHFLRFGITENTEPPPYPTDDIAPAPDNQPLMRPKTGPKALFVTHSTNIGGAPAIVASIAKWFQWHTDYDVRILTMEGGPWIANYMAIAPTYLVGCHEVGADDIQARREAVQAFVGGEPAFIFINSVAAGGFFDINPFRAPVFGYVHELDRVIRIFRSAFDKFVAGVDHFFSAGPKVQKEFQDIANLSSDKITDRPTFIAIPPDTLFVTSTDKAEIRRARGWSPDALYVVGCGVVHWRKQPDVFVRVAAKVISTFGRGVRFIWVGGGPDLDEMNKLVKDLNLSDNVEFFGHRDDVSDILKAADIFAMTSMEDAFPLVCLEAAAESVPSVIFRDATGIHAFVVPEGEPPAGIAVMLEDEDGYAEAVRNLLADNELRESMARTAYRRLTTQYTLDAACGDLLRKIRELANLRPRVTVVVPNYNYARFLDQRLDSIKSQSFKDVEIILLDDKSTDESMSILEGFQRANPGVQLFPAEENSGSPFLAWERGIDKAKGDLIWITEADDWCEPSFLELTVAAFGTPGVYLAHGRSIPTTQGGEIAGDYNEIYLNRIAKGRWERSFIDTANNEIDACLGRANTILNASGVVVLRDAAVRAIKAAVSFRLAGDWAFYVAAISGGNIAYVHEAVNYHRRHENTVTRSVEGKLAYFQELADVGALVNYLYGPNTARESGLQQFIREEADRFGFAEPLPPGRLAPHFLNVPGQGSATG